MTMLSISTKGAEDPSGIAHHPLEHGRLSFRHEGYDEALKATQHALEIDPRVLEKVRVLAHSFRRRGAAIRR